MSGAYTCRSCGNVYTTDQAFVGDQAIHDWFAGRGFRCSPCLDITAAQDRMGKVHTQGSDTEYAAARSVANVTGALRSKVLQLLKDTGARGLTDDEGGALMDGDRLTFGRRRNELADLGLVKDSGERRKTPRGRSAVVWVALP